MTDKRRLDILLVERGYAETRARAHTLIVEGNVFAGSFCLDKPGRKMLIDTPIEVKLPHPNWVSRGAIKLTHGLSYFEIDPSGCNCLDIGASTGGFTQVLLERGAVSVVAVDVGRQQFASILREDNRVTLLEGVNARYLSATDLPLRPSLVVCDASFIGLTKILPASLALASDDAALIALIKPQFEVGKGQVGKGGVVKNKSLHNQVCNKIKNWLHFNMGWSVLGITESPIHGSKGNMEFLIAAKKKNF